MLLLPFVFVLISTSIQNNLSNQANSNSDSSIQYAKVINNLTISDYQLFSLERSNTYDQLMNERAITANYAFDLQLYMKSEYCQDYTYICTVNSSSNSSNAIVIQDSDAPESCQSPFKHFITITNNFTEINEYQLYYQSSFGRYIKINDQYFKQDEESFSVDLYMTSANCSTYTFMCTVNSTLNKSIEKVVQDSDAPSECMTGYNSFVTIRNNFTIDGYVLYYSNTSGIIQKVDDFVIQKARSSFKTKIYMTSDFCHDINYICTINSSNDSTYEVSIDDSDAPIICQSQYKYFATIKNNSSESDFHLFYLSKSGKYEEIGFRYSEHSNSSFIIDLYMTSYNCQQYTFVCTVESSSEENYEKIIQNSDAPKKCQPKYYVTVKNEFTRTDFHLYYLASNDKYIEIDDEIVSIEKEGNFVIQLYMTSPYCTNYNLIYTVHSTLDGGYINVINDSYAPLICQLQSEYYLTIVNEFINADYHLFYLSESSDSYFEIENYIFFSYPESFSVDLYMTSDKCQQYRFISKVRSSTNRSYEKVFDNSNAPEICQPNKYFLTILNNFTSPDYQLYYSFDGRRYIEIENTTSIEDLSQFSVYLYMKSDLCAKQTLISQYESSLDKEYVKEINDDDAPESCQSPYTNFIKVKNNFTLSDYHLYYSKDANGSEFIEIEDSLYLENTTSFNICLYMKSDFCPEYTYIETVDSVTTRLYEKVIHNSDAPQYCCFYEICFNLNNLSLNYSIGYNRSYDEEGEVMNASRGTNIVRCDHQFSITTYLTSSPKCTEKVYLKEMKGEFDSPCFEFDDDSIPFECKDGSDDDSGSGSKKANVPLFAGLSSAAFVFVAAVAVVTVVIIKKRRSINQSLVANNDDVYTNLNDN